MGILSCKLTKDRTAAINDKYERSYSRTYLVITDDPDTDGATVRNAPGVSIGSAYPGDSGAVCTSVNAQCIDEDGKGWTVTVDYGPGEEEEENPLDRPIEISGSFNLGPEQPLDKDINGKPVVNAAGDPFLETITKEEVRAVLQIKRNEASAPTALALAYVNSINRDSFSGAPRETVRCANISYTRQIDPTYGPYFEVTYEFEFKPTGWKKKVLNVGMREIVAGKRKNILVQGVPVTEPVPLGNGGQKLNPGVPPVYLEFEVHPKLSFSAFNFGI